MIRFLKGLALAGLVISLNSCGLIGALGRSTGRVAEALGPLSRAAVGAAL